jgi:excinuclease UvrABC nuclease subunit
MNNIYKLLDKPKGLFYNHETFLMSNYIDKWGEYMLNCDAQVLTIKEFINSNKDPNVNIFIRPNGDGKNLMDR